MDQVKRCHFGYFMQYGLRARERRPAGFEAPEIGTFIHYLLENVAREVKNRGGWSQVEQEELRRLVREYIDQYAREEIDGYREKSARFRYLFSRLRTAACAIVEDMAGELAQSDFSPVAFELGFGGRDGQLPAVTVTEGDETLSVSGKVDRVDVIKVAIARMEEQLTALTKKMEATPPTDLNLAQDMSRDAQKLLGDLTEYEQELKRIQKALEITFIYVTHDQEEAMSISDMIVVMKLGVVQQIGKPQEVYDNPVNLFVAKFLGTPPIHVFDGCIRDGKLYIGGTAVLDAAMQCAAVEGAYPARLSYLEEHYGLIVNHQDYAVTYEAFASNVPPSVVVVPR